MKDILIAIQTALRAAAALDYIADANIFITADENLIPLAAGFPAIGLKDAAVTYVIEEGADWETDALVDVVIYQLLKPGDAAVIGQASPRIYGVLEIAEDVHSVLFDNKLGISGMEVALPASETPVEWMEGADLSLVKKKLTYTYHKLEDNP